MKIVDGGPLPTFYYEIELVVDSPACRRRDFRRSREVPMVFDLRENHEQIPRQEFEAAIAEQGRQTSLQTDTLIDVADKLGEARQEAQGLNDRLFLYLIDAAIFHACEKLTKQSDLGEQEKWAS
jgi:hypothetical protein